MLATAAKPFYIDPQTHAFQHDTIHLKRKSSNGLEYEFKPSIVSLAREHLLEPFASVIEEDKPLTPRTFLDSKGNPIGKVIEGVCKNIVDFQLNFLRESIDDETRDMIGDLSFLSPEFVVAPYFYLTPNAWKEWLKINLAFYSEAKAKYSSSKIFLALILPGMMLDSVPEIARTIKEIKIPVDGILLWIDSHEEENLSTSECKEYIVFLRSLKSLTSEVVNIHGGYLSELLCHKDAEYLLTGFGHSVNYGEHREVVPVGGGLPQARFYLMKAHSRLKYADAARIVISKGWLESKKTFNDKVCRCLKCESLIKEYGSAEGAFNAYGDSKVTVVPVKGTIRRFEYPTAGAKEAGIRHYLYNKAEEIKRINEQPLRELLDELEVDYKEISSVTYGALINHLKVWREAVKSVMK